MAGKDTHLDEAIEELGPFADEYRELAGHPVQLLAALRERPAFAIAFARADTVTYLRRWFTPTGGWDAVERHSGPAGPAGVVVEWRFSGVHDHDGAFNGLPPTGHPVVVRGMTMIGTRAERPSGGERTQRLDLHRYVDWAGLYAQLGLTLNWRVPLGPRRDG
jgi:hypothetical protein